MTTTHRGSLTRQVYFHDPAAPAASLVVPSVFVAVLRHRSLLLVRRCDSGVWELPGGRVDIGETAEQAAVRETAEEAGVHVAITGLVGLFTDPRHVIRSPDGEARQQFAVLFRGRVVGGLPHGDQSETSAAAWIRVEDLPELPMEAAERSWIAPALAEGSPPHLA
jgi:ADP-ribose pyrophosphatase YjhB (NUDIX family)